MKLEAGNDSSEGSFNIPEAKICKPITPEGYPKSKLLLGLLSTFLTTDHTEVTLYRILIEAGLEQRMYHASLIKVQTW